MSSAEPAWAAEFKAWGKNKIECDRPARLSPAAAANVEKMLACPNGAKVEGPFKFTLSDGAPVHLFSYDDGCGQAQAFANIEDKNKGGLKWFDLGQRPWFKSGS